MRAISGKKAFSLLELMAVVVIIMLLTAATALTLANSQPSVKMKRDAAQMVSFLRNMWDISKTSGSPLVLKPNFEKGKFSFEDPRTGKSKAAELDGTILAIKLNDRVYSAAAAHESAPDRAETAWDDEYGEAIYISEGRGITTIAVLMAMRDGEKITSPTICSLNLVTGKGKVTLLDEEETANLDVAALLGAAGTAEGENNDN